MKNKAYFLSKSGLQIFTHNLVKKLYLSKNLNINTSKNYKIHFIKVLDQLNLPAQYYFRYITIYNSGQALAFKHKKFSSARCE